MMKRNMVRDYPAFIRQWIRDGLMKEEDEVVQTNPKTGEIAHFRPRIHTYDVLVFENGHIDYDACHHNLATLKEARSIMRRTLKERKEEKIEIKVRSFNDVTDLFPAWTDTYSPSCKKGVRERH